MYKTAVYGLALGLCVFVFGSYSALPTLRLAVSVPIQPTLDLSSLAVLAEAPTPRAESDPTGKAVSGHAAGMPDAVALSNITDRSSAFANDEASKAASTQAQAAASLPGLAPEIPAPEIPAPEVKFIDLPTVTPTPLPTLVPTPLPTLVPTAVPTAQPVIFAEKAVAPPSAAPDTSSSTGCRIAGPPAELGLDPFYTKYCSALGIPIVASSDVPDPALRRAWEIITQMLGSMAQAEDIRSSIVGMSTRIGIIGAAQVTTDMPEHRGLYTLFPDVDWNTRARGVGATPQIPLLSIGEENLLCYSGDLWTGQNVLVHEFAHTIKNMGLDFVNPGFQAELQRAYQHALDAGLWPQTYVSSSLEEYWAEGVRLYFQSDGAGVPAGQTYPAHSRTELQSYDPDLYRMVESIFGPHAYISPCPAQ